MKKTLEVFFDYACPYCDKGIAELLKILPDYPDVEVRWRPCEAHPRPEFATMHSDLAAEAMHVLEDAGGDVKAFHTKVYDAHFRNGKRIDKVDLLADLVAECGGDREDAVKALKEHRYADVVDKENTLVWDELGFDAVPSYRCGSHLAGSSGGKLIPIEKVKELLEDDEA